MRTPKRLFTCGVPSRIDTPEPSNYPNKKDFTPPISRQQSISSGLLRVQTPALSSAGGEIQLRETTTTSSAIRRQLEHAHENWSGSVGFPKFLIRKLNPTFP